MLMTLMLSFFSLIKEGRTSVQTHCYLNEILKSLWMGSSTVFVIDPPHLKKMQPHISLGRRDVPSITLGGCCLGTLRENYFLSLFPSWEAWQTPACGLLYPFWEEAWWFLCWKKYGGEVLGTSILNGTLGTAVAVALCPSRSRARECSCAAQLRQTPWKVSCVTVRAQVSSAACTSSFLPLLELHHCANDSSKGMKYFHIMSATPDIASQPTAAQCSQSTG